MDKSRKCVREKLSDIFYMGFHVKEEGKEDIKVDAHSFGLNK